MIGTLGAVVFEVSANKIRTFVDLSRSGSARYQQHDVVSTKPVLEFLGPDLDSIPLQIRLDANKGIKPLEEITRLRDYMNNGERLTLIIGGSVFGDFVIEKLTDTWERIDNRGNLIIGTVDIGLKESVQQ